jgi:hypothetical protein
VAKVALIGGALAMPQLMGTPADAATVTQRFTAHLGAADVLTTPAGITSILSC